MQHSHLNYGLIAFGLDSLELLRLWTNGLPFPAYWKNKNASASSATVPRPNNLNRSKPTLIIPTVQICLTFPRLGRSRPWTIECFDNARLDKEDHIVRIDSMRCDVIGASF